MALVPRVPTDSLIRASDAIGSATLQPDGLDALAGQNPADQAPALILRLIAFSKIEKERRPSGWSIIINDKSYALTSRALFEAAAQAPLRMPKSLLAKDLAFRQSELFAIALTSAPPLVSA